MEGGRDGCEIWMTTWGEHEAGGLYAAASMQSCSI